MQHNNEQLEEGENIQNVIQTAPRLSLNVSLFQMVKTTLRLQSKMSFSHYRLDLECITSETLK